MSKLHPKIRLELLEVVSQTLFNKSEVRLYEELCTIVTENSIRCGNTQMFFTFSGEFYQIGEHKGKYPRLINTLDRELRPRMKQYLKDKAALEREQSMVLGYMQKVVLTTAYAEDYYRVLPRTLHSVLKKLDRFFLQGDGKLVGEAGTAFLAENDKYIHAMKTRMAYNLIDNR